MSIQVVYNEDYFAGIQTGSRLSARAIVPIVMELIRPSCVVDLGCGTGEFLKVFQEYGVDEILGIDGAYVQRSRLAIPQEHFTALDLRMPFTIDKTYDLAVCLEVAEHLPPESATGLIESLTRLAPIILFSAAIPHQGGTDHVNEQWLEYWVQLFRARGFEPVDALRKRIWTNPQVEVWYRQNILLFCNEQALMSNSALEKEFGATNLNQLSMVHPELFVVKCN
ncbi:MAG TPA: methyltransferase domain-containing protein [Ktedonobacteraceae bacterium]|nr:methyltransferase domain-containing protein [Ktedonobacteraceae bacterium]